MKKRLCLAASIPMLCGLFLLSGCVQSQPRDVQPVLQLTKADMKYKNVSVAKFTVSPKGVQETSPDEILAAAQSNCANELLKSALFDSVKYGSDTAASTLILQGELTELRIVGGAARFWIGAMAGRSNMTIHVKLIDAATGMVVAQKDIKEDTNPILGEFSMGAADRALPATLGSLIADFTIATAKK